MNTQPLRRTTSNNDIIGAKRERDPERKVQVLLAALVELKQRHEVDIKSRQDEWDHEKKDLELRLTESKAHQDAEKQSDSEILRLKAEYEEKDQENQQLRAQVIQILEKQERLSASVAAALKKRDAKLEATKEEAERAVADALREKDRAIQATVCEALQEKEKELQKWITKCESLEEVLIEAEGTIEEVCAQRDAIRQDAEAEIEAYVEKLEEERRNEVDFWKSKWEAAKNDDSAARIEAEKDTEIASLKEQIKAYKAALEGAQNTIKQVCEDRTVVQERAQREKDEFVQKHLSQMEKVVKFSEERVQERDQVIATLRAELDQTREELHQTRAREERKPGNWRFAGTRLALQNKKNETDSEAQSERRSFAPPPRMKSFERRLVKEAAELNDILRRQNETVQDGEEEGSNIKGAIVCNTNTSVVSDLESLGGASNQECSNKQLQTSSSSIPSEKQTEKTVTSRTASTLDSSCSSRCKSPQTKKTSRWHDTRELQEI